MTTRLFLLFSVTFIQVCVANNSPRIDISGWEKSWEDVSEFMPGKEFAIYNSQQGTYLPVSCSAEYPIDWKLSGSVSHRNTIKYSTNRRSLDNSTHKIDPFLSLSHFVRLEDASFSFRVRCGSTLETDLYSDVFIFIRGNLNSSLVNQGDQSLLTDSKTIPCVTSNPKIPVYLLQKADDETFEIVKKENISYFPTEGFRSPSYFSGTYMCRQESSNLLFVAKTTKYANSVENFIINPLQTSLQLHSNQSVELQCQSKRKSKKTSVSANDTIVTINENNGITSISFNDKSHVGNVVKLFCKSGEEVVYEWEVRLVATLALELDNYYGEINCLAEASPRKLQTLRCVNSMNCNYLRSCLDGLGNCNFINQITFESTYEDSCLSIVSGKVLKCASVLMYHYAGLARCRAGGAIQDWEFFAGLNLQKYSNWKDAPTEALVRLDPLPNSLEPGSNLKLVCEAVSYLFANSLSFEIEYKNNTRKSLQNDENIKILNPEDKHERLFKDFNVIGILEMIFPHDVKAIHCLAPMINGTDVLRSSKSL